MSSFNNINTTSNLDNLLLHSLMDRLQIRPPSSNNNNNNNNNNNPFLTQSLEDLLLDSLTNHLNDIDDEDNHFPTGFDDTTSSSSDARTQLAKEESRLEKHIIRTILSGNTDSLKPNSGQAVTINEHHICVGFHEEKESDYRVWEWHGHIMLFDDENGYSPEYIYGNYFERLVGKNGAPGVARKVPKEEVDEEEEEDDKVLNSGLRELIDGGVSGAGGDTNGARILHRNINAGSSKV